MTVLRALVARFNSVDFVYLADHAHVPYGNQPSEAIVGYTRDCVEELFARGAHDGHRLLPHGSFSPDFNPAWTTPVEPHVDGSVTALGPIPGWLFVG